MRGRPFRFDPRKQYGNYIFAARGEVGAGRRVIVANARQVLPKGSLFQVIVQPAVDGLPGTVAWKYSPRLRAGSPGVMRA